MPSETSYSPVLWGAVVIPILSGTELFIDPQTRESYGFFILGFLYLASIRYTLAVALGVYSHEYSLKKNQHGKIGVILWLCYFMMLILCSLLVPGAAILGMTITISMALMILILSIIQGAFSSKEHDEAEKKNITWRFYLDVLLLLFVAGEFFFAQEISLQAPFFAVGLLLFLDFRVSESAKSNVVEMFDSLKTYFVTSWRRTSESP